MSDKFQNLVVALDTDIRAEDVEELIKAIGFFRGVASVELGEAVGLVDYLARTRERQLLKEQIGEILRLR